MTDIFSGLITSNNNNDCQKIFSKETNNLIELDEENYFNNSKINIHTNNQFFYYQIKNNNGEVDYIKNIYLGIKRRDKHSFHKSNVKKINYKNYNNKKRKPDTHENFYSSKITYIIFIEITLTKKLIANAPKIKEEKISLIKLCFPEYEKKSNIKKCNNYKTKNSLMNQFPPGSPFKFLETTKIVFMNSGNILNDK